MTKQEVELIILKAAVDGQDAIHMKIYKNGTVCRYGAGGLPQLGSSGMSFFSDARYFESLIVKIPEDMVSQPFFHEEPGESGYLEYLVAFYGVSDNGDTGERANRTKTSGARVKLGRGSQFAHPIMGQLDSLLMDATELTNEWYFDIMVKVAYGALSSSLPHQTIITQPQTEREVQDDFENYINQIFGSARGWSMANFARDKTYEKEGKHYKGLITHKKDFFKIDFVPLDQEGQNTPGKSPWWKFW